MPCRAVAVACSLALVVASGGPALAGPLAGAAAIAPAAASELVQEARIFCYNTYSGRFLHWGRCGGGYPRVYCRSNYTGRFLHWGRC